VSATPSGHHGGLFLCESCSFENVADIWARELWPGRISAIEPNSAMKWLGGIDMELMKSNPSFWRVLRTGETVGVLSGHFGGLVEGNKGLQRSYRTRGLWVSTEVRRQGVAKLLMQAAFNQAADENCFAVWTFPRESSMPFYESVGFRRVGNWIGVNDPGAGEFGPNCYALVRR
jgi:GNAT superfamily N-acetyltransferase